MFSKTLLILSLVSVAFATVYVTNPTSASVISGGSSTTVTWQDDGNPPSLAQFGASSVAIYTGNARQQTSLQVISTSVNVSSTSSVNFTVNPTIGPNSHNYFIRFESLDGKDSSGTPYLSFSAEFTLANMTGMFSSAILSEIAGQATAPLASPTTTANVTTPSMTTATSSSITSSTPSSTPSANATNSAMDIKAGWAGLVLGAVVGVAMF